ncbi:MAG: hypothetical protein AB4911_23190 [Oscillochloridaceae bacterium umkhey_bin13]
MTVFLLWLVGTGIFAILIVVLWQIWQSYLSQSPAEEAQERNLAELNDAQANRVSDQHLTRPVDTDAAWRTMVERGGEPPRRRRKPRR